VVKTSTKTRIATGVAGGICIGIVGQLLGEGRHLALASLLLCIGIVCLSAASS
jgi:hypothetical protein